MKQLKAIFRAGLIMGMGLFFSCSTSVKTVDSGHLDTLPKLATGAMVSINFSSQHPVFATGTGCYLRLQKDSELKPYDVTISPGVDVFFLDLPAGGYTFTEYRCGKRSGLKFHKDAMAPFRVFEGKISLIGGVHINVSNRKRAGINFISKKNALEKTKIIFDKIPADSQTRVVSAFTGTPITLENVRQIPSEKKEWELRDAKGEAIKPKQDWPSARECYREENRSNGLWLGYLEIDAEYFQGELMQANPGGQWNAFSDQFKACVQDVLKNFHPKNLDHIHYFVAF